MADVTLDIGGHRYTLSCADGEEEDLIRLSSIVDEQIKSARLMAGGLSEARQLLFASILLAEQLDMARKSVPAAGAKEIASTPTDQALADATRRIDALTARVERLIGGGLESGDTNS